jgi:hypothetical protein
MPSTSGIISSAGFLKNPAEPLSLGYRVNYIKNPSFEINTTGWSSITAASIARTTSEGQSGSSSLSVTDVSGAAIQFGSTGSMIPFGAGSGSYTISAYVKLGVGNTTANYFLRQIQYESENSTTTIAAGNGGTQSLSYTGNWARLSYTFTKESAANFLVIRVRTDSSTNSDSFLIDSVMFEKSSSAGSYFDGSNGGFWTGEAHNSFSGASSY